MQGQSDRGGEGGAPAELRVVLVEDHADYREQLQHQLEALGSVRVVQGTANPREAVEWLVGHPHDWDLVVLDMFLSGGHGFEVLRSCAARSPQQRAIFLTSYTRQPASSRALAMGADAVFCKTDVGGFLRFVARQRDMRTQLECH
jgi:DNA-binding NarL/FixJ family response regulator